MARLNFDARTVAPDAGAQEAIPAGWYIAQIDQSEVKPTSSGDGSFLECRYVILDGQHKGRKVFSRFNLRNPSEEAVRIAYGQLSALCHAVGVVLCEDSQQLHNLPVKVKVSVRKGSPKKDKDTGLPTGENYEDSNDIKAWANVNAETPAAGAQAPQQGFQAPQTGFQAPQQPQAQTWGAPAPAPAPAQQAWAPQQQQPQQQPQQPPAGTGAPPWAGQQPPAAAPAAAPATAPSAPPWATGGAGGAAPPWATGT